MTKKLWQQIRAVNLSVNNNVKALDDFDHFGKDEFWDYPIDGYGDCEDYVLEKRRILLEAGVPISDLLITVAMKPDGDGHAVLTVRTEEGDFILDSLNPHVLRWDRTKYRYVNAKRAITLETGSPCSMKRI